jgi:NAD(P)-dependent dehydrogenase (short-subunit alcohol dehydrogenase family)
MTAHLTDRVALVTGGGTGIGRATALALARAGATVVVAGRTHDPLAGTAKLVADEGGRADAVTADVSRADQVAGLVAEIVDRHGGLHVAVNSAGLVGTPGPMADLDDDAWATVLGTNLTGVWLSMKHEIAHMRMHGGGTIVNIASTWGAHSAAAGFGAYSASKAAVSTLTKSAAKEYIGDGIRINAISPGPIDTPMSRAPGETDAERDARIAQVLPIGRVGTTDEVAAAAVWLTSPDSAFVVGHDLVIDGGATA